MRKVTKMWKCQDGRKIRICDMEDKHLMNTIFFLERSAKQLMEIEHRQFLSIPGPSGDYATDAWLNAIDTLSEETYEDYLPDVYEKLELEAQRRNLL